MYRVEPRLSGIQAGRKEVLKVAGENQQNNPFDFSQDALDFKARLWKKLQARMAAAAVQELEDDDLEWVSAAGMAAGTGDDKLPD